MYTQLYIDDARTAGCRKRVEVEESIDQSTWGSVHLGVGQPPGRPRRIQGMGGGSCLSLGAHPEPRAVHPPKIYHVTPSFLKRPSPRKFTQGPTSSPSFPIVKDRARTTPIQKVSP
jgi:hypothetical protein